MSDNIKEFKKLYFNSTSYLVHEADYVIVEKDTRIYYKVLPDDIGFEFYATTFASIPVPQSHEDCYLSEDFKAECLFHGTAYSEGVRHMYMGDSRTDNECYLYYPNTLELSKVFEKLSELEKKFCPYRLNKL